MATYNTMTYWTFQWPEFLAFIALLPGLIYLTLRLQKQRKLAMQLLNQQRSLAWVNPQSLRIWALFCLIIALARPGYNPQPLAHEVKGRDVVIALDVSRSMLAADLQPNRLEVAKQGVRDLLDTISNQRVGLIVYGGSASILCPLSRDSNFVYYMLEQAGPNSVDFGGTQLQAAIEKAIDQVFDTANLANSDLIILSDGGNLEATEASIAERIHTNEIRTHIVGLGDPNISSAIAINDANDPPVFIKYKEQIVRSKLEDSALKSLASKSEWIQYHAIGTAPFDLGSLYSQNIKPASSPQKVSTNRYHYQEAAPWLIGFAILLMLLSRQRFVIKWSNSIALWLLLTLLFPADVISQTMIEPKENQLAIKRMQQGQFEAAAMQFEALYQGLLAQDAPASHLAIVQYNLGLAWSQQALETESLEDQLDAQKRSQAAFLLAKRWHPSLLQASGHLDQNARNIARIELALAAQSQAEQAQADQMHELVNSIKELQAKQRSIREQFGKKAFLAAKLVLMQQTAIQDAQKIKTALSNLQATTESSNPPDKITLEILSKAQSELSRCYTQQQTLLKLIPNYPLSPKVCLELTAIIEAHIQRLIELFSAPLMESDESDKSNESNDEWTEMDNTYTQTNSDKNGLSLSSSHGGDFVQSSIMQALPQPNYSAETILMDEEGSQQFRHQQRRAAKAAKVKRDY